MTGSFKLLIVSLLMTAGIIFGSRPLQAQLLDPICQSNPTATICMENTPQSTGGNRIYGPGGILTKIAHLLSVVVGIVSIFVLIIGAIRFIGATGDINKINSARDSILFAVVGLVLAALAQSVVIFILNKL